MTTVEHDLRPEKARTGAGRVTSRGRWGGGVRRKPPRPRWRRRWTC